MKKILIVSSLLSSSVIALSQQFDFTVKDNWSDKPVLQTVHAVFDSSSAVGILDERTIEYKTEGKEIPVYTTYHKIIKIKNDRGVEMFNKVYIPVYENAEISNIRARTIFPGGKVIDLDSTKIKETQEDGETYKIFALEGVEPGAEVEYSYTSKRGFTLFGSEIFQSASVPYQQENFRLIAPSNLRFSAKGYNGFNVSTDSAIGDRRIIVGYDTDVKELEEEKYAYRDQYLKRVDYKLSYNLAENPDVRLYTWKQYAKRAFDYYTEHPAKEDKALDNFVSQIKFKDNADDADKILAVEDYIKTNINIDKKLIAEGADDIEKIIKTKAANNDGTVKLFTGVFDKLGITYQIVLAGDRTGFPLDEELEDWNRTDEILFFFPQTGKYISPDAEELRYPFIPFNLAATKGLFLKGTVIGTFKTAIGSFADVAMEPFESSAMNMEADVKFNDTQDTLLISSKQVLKGYGATQYRPIYVFLPKDKQDDASKEIIKAVSGSTDITNIKVENTALTDYFYNKPLIISGDIKSAELLENAGSKILLKIGEIIGPQEQMYQEKPRQLPVEMPFPHMEQRKITLHIPDGYTVKNPDDLNFNISYKENDTTTMGFVSGYTQTGNTISILITEEYKKINYSLEQFEDFKKVINSSADFNKVVLVLQKKE